MPLHPLVIHAAVVLVPLAAIAAIAFVVPRWRSLARWPALVVTALAALAVQLSAMTGEDLEEKVGGNRMVADHAMWAGRLQFTTWVLFGAVVIAFWALPHVTMLRDGKDKPPRAGVLERPLMVLLPLLAVAVLVLVVVTGDAGARAVWAS